MSGTGTGVVEPPGALAGAQTFMCFNLPMRPLRTSWHARQNSRAERCCVPNWNTRLCFCTARRNLWSSANDKPIGLATAYYPALRFSGLLAMLHEGTRTTEILKHFGVQDYVRAHSRITTQMPAEETAQLLHQPVNRPLLCVECLDVDMAGVPIKYGETVFCGDRVQLVVSSGDEA